jgi:hypothetical protein
MPTPTPSIFRVLSPIVHPVAAAAGQYIAWYPGQDLVVLRPTRSGYRIKRRLGFDNAGALGMQLENGAITCVYERGSGQRLPARWLGRPVTASPRTPRPRWGSRAEP